VICIDLGAHKFCNLFSCNDDAERGLHEWDFNWTRKSKKEWSIFTKDNAMIGLREELNHEVQEGSKTKTWNKYSF